MSKWFDKLFSGNISGAGTTTGCIVVPSIYIRARLRTWHTLDRFLEESILLAKSNVGHQNIQFVERWLPLAVKIY